MMNAKINTMTSEHITTNQAALVLAMTSDREPYVKTQPFVDNFDYLQALENEARLILVRAMLRKYGVEQRQDDNYLLILSHAGLSPEKANHDMVDHLLRAAQLKNDERAEDARLSGVDIIFPRFCREMNIERFDREVVLLLFMLATNEGFAEIFALCGFKKPDEKYNGLTIGTILTVLCQDYREQMVCRKKFSVDGTLMTNEILFMTSDMDKSSNIVDKCLCLHERYVRHILGDNNLYSSSYQFICRDRGSVDLKQVIMPEPIKNEIVSCIGNYLTQREKPSAARIDKFLGYGTALTMLFFGSSGTGKTMMVQALARHFDRQLFSLKMENISRNRSQSFDDLLESVFREASLNNGIVFFDEADDLFKDESLLARSLLIQIEKARCIVILATNKAIALDPAMERRLSMKVHFMLPEMELRCRIWESLMPDFVKIALDVDFNYLANRYLFSGGLIKNTILMAVNMALSGNHSEQPLLTRETIEKAANLQAISMHDMSDLCEEYTPDQSVSDLHLMPAQREEISRVASAYKILRKNGLGLNILVHSSDFRIGLDTADALAAECGLKVRQFSYYRVSKIDIDEKVIHPVKQRKVWPMVYAFVPSTGEPAMILFMDWVGMADWSERKDNSGDDYYKKTKHENFFSNLREYRGLFCMVTDVPLKGPLPTEFNIYIDLESPLEEDQMRRWEEHLGKNRASDDELVSLVEENPMHISEIDFIGRQALIQAIIQGTGAPTLEIVSDVISRYRRNSKVPVLFGQS
jgi:DNA polymerase III delta prime subunit